MDKIAANQHFVSMKKEVKKAKGMVSCRLMRKARELKTKILNPDADDTTKLDKMKKKHSKLLEEIKLIHPMDPYIISREATLKPGIEGWNKVISHSKATPEERVMGYIILKNNIQRQVNRFREEQKDCDEWLNEYIEYREKKRQARNAQ